VFAKETLERLEQFKNIDYIEGDSTAVAPRKVKGKPELVFFDTDHTYKRTVNEVRAFRSIMKPGGIMLFDDVRVGPEMEQFWSWLEDPKLELPELHWTSFGVKLA